MQNGNPGHRLGFRLILNRFRLTVHKFIDTGASEVIQSRFNQNCGMTVCMIFGLFQLLMQPIHGQATPANYELAKSLDKRVADKVLREQIQPHWLPDGSFWYRVKTGPSNKFEWVFVRPDARLKQVVFNSDQWINSVEKTIGEKPSENTINRIVPIDGKPDNFRIRAGNRWWIWSGTDQKITLDPNQQYNSDKELGLTSSRASLRQGPETFVTFMNRTSANAHLQWIDADGKPKGYGHITAGKERKQHTFGGHVWRVFDDEGNDILWVEAEDTPSSIEILPVKRDKPSSISITENKETKKQKNPFEIRDFNIIRKESVSNHAEILTHDGTEQNAYRGPVLISPDGQYLVARRVKPEQKHTVTIIESSPEDQLQPRKIEFQYLKPGDQIEQSRPVLIDLKTKKQVEIDSQLIENPWSIDDWHWAEDSSEIFFLYNKRGHQVVRLIGLNSGTGKLRVVAEEKFDTFVDYANKIWIHWLPGSQKLIWMSERSGWNHLLLVDVTSGAVEKHLTQGEWAIRKVEKVDNDKKQIWFYAGGHLKNQDPYQLHLGRVGFDGTGLTFLTEGDGNHTVTFSPDQKLLIDRYSRVDLAPVYELRNATDGSLILKLEAADASLLTDSGWTMPERFVAKGRDGQTDIFGVIYRPSNFDASKKYPVIEEIYAGPHGAHVPKSWGLQLRQHKIAELGFIVVQIDGMGTNWRSKAFHDVASRNLADAGFPDRKLWIKAAASTRPWMDLTRVGIYGGSAGGQNAMRALIDHHDFYKVAVADCGCHDNRMDKIWWNELWLGWPVGPQYELNSNTVHAHRMQGKLLLIVGELDRNVDPASTMQVANALVKSNKDFELLVVPGAGHGSAETPYGSRRRMEFLVKHLLNPGVNSR